MAGRAHDHKEVTAKPAKTGSSSSADAAAGIGFDEWVQIGRRAKLESGLAGQCAEQLVKLACSDQETGRRALERLSERVASGSVTNPVGLFRSILEQPGGPELSREAVKRQRAEDHRRAKFNEFRQTAPREHLAMLYRRVRSLAAQKLSPAELEQFVQIKKWNNPVLVAFVVEHWDELSQPQHARAGAA